MSEPPGAQMLARVPLPDANVHPVPVEGLSPEQSAVRYEEILQAHYGARNLDPRRPLSAESASLGSGRFLALYEMGQQLLEQREPGPVLRTIHEAIVHHLEPDRACLLAVSGDGSCHPLFCHQLELKPPPERWPVLREEVLLTAPKAGP